MSIDQGTDSGTNPSQSEPIEDQQEASSDRPGKKRAIDLSPAQVLGGALAAMTAAAIGSRLGAAGTIIGAAAASVVAAVASAVYTASLRHTHARVRTVWSGRWNSGTPGAVEVISDHADTTAATARPQHTARQRQAPLSAADARRRWKRPIVGALLAFGIAAAVLTGFELISGHALSGGEGTTVTQVSNQNRGTDPAKPAPASKPEEKKPAATSEPTQSPEPSASSSPDQKTPTASQDPTETPVPTTRASSSEPTPSGTPSG